MKVVILSGGFGTRLSEETALRPKPMVEIGHQPILWHIMKIFASFGHNEFIVALGYKGQVIKDYFLDYYHMHNDLSITLHDGAVEVREISREDWCVRLIDTGLRTGTGGRIKRLAQWIGNETFMMTYGDGLADIDLRELLKLHRRHGKIATVTTVRPPARFGRMDLDGDLVVKFSEKPQIGEGWINGGFFVLEPQVLDYVEGDEVMFERDPLEMLAADRQLVAFPHHGFWQCVDTLRDLRLLEELWNHGKAPWKIWDE